MNYANIAWASPYKSNLEGVYRHQKYAGRIIEFKDRFIHAQPPFHDMKALKIFQVNLFQTIFFMFKCKKKIPPPISNKLFMPKPENKYNIRSRRKLTEPFYRKKHTQFKIGNELAHDNFSMLDSLPLFRKKIKEFILMFHDIWNNTSHFSNFNYLITFLCSLFLPSENITFSMGIKRECG